MTVAVAVAAALAVACSSKEDKAAGVEGEWELVDVEFATKSAVVGSETVCLYKFRRERDVCDVSEAGRRTLQKLLRHMVLFERHSERDLLGRQELGLSI